MLLPPMDHSRIVDRVREVAERFASHRHERQRRRELDPADFAALADAGLLLTGVPARQGGLFESVARSSRPIGELFTVLARGDSSVALVTAMHAAVLGFWHATPEVPEPASTAWREQSEQMGRHALDGAWFGTITSEPGSGGDVARTRTVARRDADGVWRLTGKKHFGSGSGVTSFMLTSARAEGEADPDWFVLDLRAVPWDGTRGLKLIAPWDGHGMIATQSHGMELADFPALRFAWPGNWRALSDAAGPLVGVVFTSVVLGIVELAMETARAQLSGRAGSLSAFERVELTNAEKEAWLMRQSYEGMLRAVESEPSPQRHVLLGKTACAELAEECLRRLTRLLGGGTFARHSPFGFWFEDVRALGFLRPPWALAYEVLGA